MEEGRREERWSRGMLVWWMVVPVEEMLGAVEVEDLDEWEVRRRDLCVEGSRGINVLAVVVVLVLVLVVD